MKSDTTKIQSHSLLFQLNFKTQYCLQITAVDPISYRKYSNNNAQFNRIPKTSIVAALEGKNPKELQCKIREEFEQKLDQKQSKEPLLQTKCLRLQFTVSPEYIQPFSQTIMLYEVQNNRQLDSIVPQKLTKEQIKEVKRNLDQISARIPTGDQPPEQMFQVQQIPAFQLIHDRAKQEKIIMIFIAYNVIALLGWISYFEFTKYLTLVLLSVAVLVVYYRSHKYLLRSIQLKKGTYRISISGQMSVQNYSQCPNDSFLLYFEMGRFSYKKMKLYVSSMNCYAYPFTGSLMVEVDKDKEIHVKIQKNVKFYPVSLQNVIITADKVSNFVATK